MTATKTAERTSGPSTRRDDIVHVCRVSFDDPDHECSEAGLSCRMFCGAAPDGEYVSDVPAGMVGCVVCEAMEARLL